MINWDKLFLDYYIDFNPQNNRGWTEIQCPHCDDTGKRGGFHKDGNYNCFRCGKHKTVNTIVKLLDYPLADARVLIRKYNDKKILFKEEGKEFANKIEFPPGIKYGLHSQAFKYIKNRNFDPFYLLQNYHIRQTDIYGAFSHRIIIPIYRNGILISYMGRDFTDKARTKYMACPMKKEVYHYKWSAYGIDLLKSRSALLVEGITDMWRMGPGSLALYGVKFTRYQLVELAKKIDKAFILFDPDDAGQIAAEKLQRELELFNVKTENLYEDTGRDPGEYTNDEASEIMKELGL